MKKILVIGASGFLGSHLVSALLAEGYAVRGLVRSLTKAKSPVAMLLASGCELVRGDVSDPVSVQAAMEGVEAVYISIHTLSPQPASKAGEGFMDVEIGGLENIVSACRMHGVRRLIYVTSLGVVPDAISEWTRERWKAQQMLLTSGLDVTVLQPGQIAGVGGMGFNMMVSQAKSSVALMLANSRQRWRNIAVDDLVYYLVGVLNDARSYGRTYEVGCDDVLTSDEMVDVTAEVLGRKHPRKIHIPRALMRAMAPLIERFAKLPRGSFRGLVDGMEDGDMTGDPLPIRALLPRPPLTYRQAVKRAVEGT